MQNNRHTDRDRETHRRRATETERQGDRDSLGQTEAETNSVRHEEANLQNLKTRWRSRQLSIMFGR